MIGKIKKGKSFGGCIRYVMGKDKVEIIASEGVLLGSNREMIDSFNYQCLLNPKIKQPLGHIALSFKPEDAPRLNDEPMASIKVKFRPSTSENKEETIYYQIIQNRVIRQLKTDYRLFVYEWNEVESSIIITNSSRQHYLTSIEERIDWDIKQLQSIINQLENKRVKYTADDRY